MSEKDLEQLKREAVEKAKAAAAKKLAQMQGQGANASAQEALKTEEPDPASSETKTEASGDQADAKAKAAAAAKAKAAAAAKAKAAALAKQKGEAGTDSDAGAAALEAAGPNADPENVAASAQAAANFQAEGATALPEGSDDKAKAIAAAKAKAAAAAKAKAAAAAKAGGEAASGDDEKAKAIAAAKAKAAAAAKAKAGGAAAGGDDEKAKAIAAAKAKAAALTKAKSSGTEGAVEEAPTVPSPNQPYLDKYVKVIEDHLGKDVLEDSYINNLSKDVPTLVAKPETYYRIAEFLKYNEQLGFDYLSEHHGSDFETHMEVYNHLYSYKNRQSVALKVKISREDPQIDSLTPLWAGANWPERESYDLVGIKYLNHPNLQRIMLADDWVGHPLRKDYEQYDVEV